MVLLLDTNAFIWSLAQPEKLGRFALAEIINSKNRIYVSAVSLLECAIKIRAEKLSFSFKFSEIEESINDAMMLLLPFDAWAAEQFINLPKLSWSDPFDGAIMAQALAKHMTLITSDQKILDSKVDGLKIMDARA